MVVVIFIVKVAAIAAGLIVGSKGLSWLWERRKK